MLAFLKMVAIGLGAVIVIPCLMALAVMLAFFLYSIFMYMCVGLVCGLLYALNMVFAQ